MLYAGRTVKMPGPGYPDTGFILQPGNLVLRVKIKRPKPGDEDRDGDRQTD